MLVDDPHGFAILTVGGYRVTCFLPSGRVALGRQKAERQKWTSWDWPRSLPAPTHPATLTPEEVKNVGMFSCLKAWAFNPADGIYVYIYSVYVRDTDRS